MYAQLHWLSAIAASNQFIILIKMDTFFGAQRLASRGSGFLTSEEVPSVIARGMPMEIVESRIVALVSSVVRVCPPLGTFVPHTVCSNDGQCCHGDA